MALTQRIAFIGAGNMASALIEGLLAAGTSSASRIVATDVQQDALAALAQRHGIVTTTDNAQAVADADVVILSVKPQVLPLVLSGIAASTSSSTLVVSIAAGVPLSLLEGGLPPDVRVIRAMPNTPALVRAGATAIAPGSQATDADMESAEAIFRSVGIVERVPEAQLDAVTGLSGSGPAYVFLMIEALTDAGVQVGLTQETASALAAQTVYGAALLLRETGEAPSVLRQRVTSPGGTTQAGLESLQAAGFRSVIAGAVKRATARGAELGREAAKKR